MYLTPEGLMITHIMALYLEIVPVAVIVLHGLVVDYVDDWNHERQRVLLNE